jgi:PST family polysaccharide transporter
MVGMLSGIALVRLLGVEQFGIFAFALSISAVMMSINDVGQVVAVINYRGPDVHRAARTAAALAMTTSCTLYIACFLAAPWLAQVIGGGDGTGVVRVMTFVVVLDSFTTAPRGLLLRSFRQKRLAITDLVSVPVNAAVSIALAIAGAGAWAPAFGTVAAASVTCGAVLLSVPYIPWPGFDRTAARRLLHFGLPFAGTTFIEYLLINADNLIVGSALGAAALGFYALAFNISSWPSTVVTQAVRRVSIPEFSRLADDPDAARATFTRSFVLLATVLFPLCTLLAVLAAPLVSFVYGAEKLAAAPVLRWLAVLGAVRVLVGFIFDYLAGLGRARTALALQICWLAALLPALVVGAHLDGIRGAAIAHVVVVVVVTVPLFLSTLNRARIDLPAVGRQLLRPALGVLAVIVLGALAELTLPNSFVHLLVFAPLMLIVYTVVAVPLDDLRRLALPLLHRGAT